MKHEIRSRIADISGYLGLVTSVTQTVLATTNVLTNPIMRFFLWIICSLLFGAAFLTAKKTAILDANQRPMKNRYRPNWYWLAPFLLVASAGTTDIVAYFGKPPAYATIIDVNYAHNVPLDIAQDAVSTIEQAESKELTPDSTFNSEAPLLGSILYLQNFSRPVLKALTNVSAQEFYNVSISDHFRFEIVKDHSVNEVVIENVHILVHRFIPLPTFQEEGGAEGLGDTENDILVFELSPKLDDPLPWEYPPKFHLNDRQSQSVLPWNAIKTAKLKDNFSRQFVVKITSTAPGIYSYTASITVREPLKSSRKMPLIHKQEPALAAFTTVTHVEKFSDELLKKYGFARNTYSYEQTHFEPVTKPVEPAPE